MFLPAANIGIITEKDGKWRGPHTLTFEEWVAGNLKRTNPKKFEEPVSKYTVHISNGNLAFVLAEAIESVDGEAISDNRDYFILMKDEGKWKFLSGSYTATSITE